MKFKILQMDLRKSEDRTLLMYLQSKCLPYDKPMDVDRGHWWVAYTEEGKPVAFAGLIRSQQWSNAGYMCRAGVLEKYQGYGLQKRLIRARIKKARSLNWEWLITDTTDNPASSNSLISMGFKIYEPKVPWANKNSLYWRLNVFEGKKRAAQRQRKAE
jgi:ribosomal protein S18 acetylase RimI-like enzyme